MHMVRLNERHLQYCKFRCCVYRPCCGQFQYKNCMKASLQLNLVQLNIVTKQCKRNIYIPVTGFKLIKVFF